VINKAKSFPQEIIQVPEVRAEYQADRDYYYKVFLDYAGLPYQIFVELILNNDDPELPAVTIVSVHRQRS